MHRSHSGVACLAADNSNADKKDQEQAIQESSWPSTAPMATAKANRILRGDSSKLPSDFSLAVKLIKTWLLSFWVFFYQGAEVGYGSRTVTFLLDSRGDSEDTTGYISTDFWTGITLTILTAFGSSGDSLFPFLIGLMSRFIGTYVLHPLFISLMRAMLLVWLIVPNVERIDKYGPPKNILQHIW